VIGTLPPAVHGSSLLVHPLVIGFLASGHPENHRPLGQPLAMILIILSLVAALVARYTFAVAARSPSSLCSNPPLDGSRLVHTSTWKARRQETHVATDRRSEKSLMRGPGAVPANHSERSACMTSTRAARAAGSIEATTAAPKSTNAETITGNAPGIFKSPK
jgi:hypothetical protein